MGSRGFQGGAVRFKEVQGGSYIKEKREEDYLPHGFHFSPGRDGSTNNKKGVGGAVACILIVPGVSYLVSSLPFYGNPSIPPEVGEFIIYSPTMEDLNVY